MGYYKEKSKAPQFILWVVVALVTIGLIVAIIVGISKNGNRKPEVPPENNTNEEPMLPVEKPPVIPPDTDVDIEIPVIKPTPTEPEIPEVEKPDIDVGEMTRNPEPEVSGGEIEYGTKE